MPLVIVEIDFLRIHAVWSRAVTIYVGNLSFKATEEAVQEFFGGYGEVKRVSLPVDRETGRMRGFAFIEMASDEEEDRTIAVIDGEEWMGRPLRVSKARPREATL
jgi:RNA recognition motif-containing protein